MLAEVLDIPIRSFEKQLGVSLDYLRHIAETSTRLFFKFSKVRSLADCRRACPKDAFHLATLVATRAEDCGSCVQIGINLAKQEGVSVDVINAAVFSRTEGLTDDLRVVHQFALSCLTQGGPSEDQRKQVSTLYGEEALIELAVGMAGARVFPQVKRTLGFHKSCRVMVPEV